ncbi:hypothetical protein RUM43_002870 [Polyplax serrata]|uniref:Methylosome protein 50 n=1 Tax=Polyplax serrata TaxID=468196 RepID=A0AAN8PDH8_POLSC
MENDIYQSEPNLLAEAYRNQCNVQKPRRIEKNMDFLDINNDGLFLLGTSSLSGRIWSGSIWVFNTFPSVPNIESSIAGIDFETGVAVGLWSNNKNVVIGSDSGSLHHLTLDIQTDSKTKPYFRINGVVTEHDDSIVALDLMKNMSKIISGGMDMNIKIWDEETLLCEKSYCPAHGHIVTSVSSQKHHSDIFVSTSLDRTSLMWDTRLEKPASLLIENECGYTSSSWVDNDCVILGSNDGSLSIIDLRAKQVLDTNFCSQRPIFKLLYNGAFQIVAVCADDPSVHAFSVKGKKLTEVYTSKERHKDFVRGLAWDTSLKTLYSCGWDSKVLQHNMSEEYI